MFFECCTIQSLMLRGLRVRRHEEPVSHVLDLPVPCFRLHTRHEKPTFAGVQDILGELGIDADLTRSQDRISTPICSDGEMMEGS